MADYFPGGSKTIEPWFFGSLTNDQGAPVDPGPATFDNELALNRFIVFRGNKVRSNGGIVAGLPRKRAPKASKLHCASEKKKKKKKKTR